MTTYKESLAFVGGDSSGKSTCLLELAHFHPESNVVLLDLDNKIEKLVDVYFPHLRDRENMHIHQVRNSGMLLDHYQDAKGILKVNDWLLADGIDKFWEILQGEWEKADKKPGNDQWGWIKGTHNDEFMEPACNRAPFNVGMTMWAGPIDSYTLERTSDQGIKQDFQLWQQYGFKPEGYKRNSGYFETIFALRTEASLQEGREKHFVSTYKDKARPYIRGEKKLWREFSFPFFPLYVETVNKAIEEGRPTAALTTGYKIESMD